jgi:hypothetical protein
VFCVIFISCTLTLTLTLSKGVGFRFYLHTNHQLHVLVSGNRWALYRYSSLEQGNVVVRCSDHCC